MTGCYQETLRNCFGCNYVRLGVHCLMPMHAQKLSDLNDRFAAAKRVAGRRSRTEVFRTYPGRSRVHSANPGVKKVAEAGTLVDWA